MAKVQKCEVCKAQPAAWAMQYIASDQPSFYLLGWHVRGFSLRRVCDACKDQIQSKQGKEG